MKRVRYAKYSGDLASEIDLEDVLKALSDYFLDSGFYDPDTHFQDLDNTLEDLREALRRALQNSDFFDEQLREQLQQLQAQGKLDELIDKLIQRLEQANYISSSNPWDDPQQTQRRPASASLFRRDWFRGRRRAVPYRSLQGHRRVLRPFPARVSR